MLCDGCYIDEEVVYEAGWNEVTGGCVYCVCVVHLGSATIESERFRQARGKRCRGEEEAVVGSMYVSKSSRIHARAPAPDEEQTEMPGS